MNEMEHAVSLGKPFYLYMSHYTVHAPWEEDERFYQKYKDQGLTGIEAYLASMIEGMDKSLGDLMNKVKELGIEENTIILFISDNGSPMQCPQNLPLRGHKVTPYEGGIRVPMIVKWPGVVKAETTCAKPLIIDDFFPSILEMAEIEKHKHIAKSVDGESFVPMLKEKQINVAKREFVWHFPHNYDVEPYSVIRKGDWKLIYWYKDEKSELYNIAQDISETNDLSKMQPKITHDLLKRLRKHLVSVEASHPFNKQTNTKVPFPSGKQTKLSGN